MLIVFPLRYFTIAALLSCLPLASLLAEWRRPRGLGALLVMVLVVWGIWIGTQGATRLAARTEAEKEYVTAKLTMAQKAVQEGRKLVFVGGLHIVGLDAAIKALDPSLIGRIVILNSSYPTHVVTTDAWAAQMNLLWSDRLPNNPSRGFGLVWGEARAPEK